MARTVAAATVGGLTSVLGGGKFADGAITGAFSRLFNDEGENLRKLFSKDQVVNPTGKGIRCDIKGCGNFGDRRADQHGKVRPGGHQGVDYVSTPGQDVMAIADGTVAEVYNSGGIAVNGTTAAGREYAYRILYIDVDQSMVVGAPIKMGQVLGTARDITKVYGAGMTNHVHVEIWAGGKPHDAAKYIPSP